jgi:hypothetical protein
MMSFYMTDFLCRQFEAFFIKPLGLDRHPELVTDYFGNYEKLIYLAGRGRETAGKSPQSRSHAGADLRVPVHRLWRPDACASGRLTGRKPSVSLALNFASSTAFDLSAS